jgi:hypothetical protein
MLAPELLLSHLQLAAEGLADAGHHLAALPVLQLARLIALVAINSEVRACCAHDAVLAPEP